MALNIPLEIAGVGVTTFTSATALSADQRLTGGLGSIANNTLFVRVPTAASPPVTAYATGMTFTQSKEGAPIFVANETGVFSLSTSQAFATPVKLGANSVGTIAISLTALGYQCALGVQTGTITLTISSYALSGNAAGTSVVAVPATALPTATISLTAVNVASDSGAFTCEEEARRLWVLGYV